MASVAMVEGDRSLSIGQVLSRGFGTLGGNPLATFGIAAVFSGIPAQALGYALQRASADLIMMLDGWGTAALGILSFGGAMILSVVTQGALVRATVAYTEGRRARLGECLSAGLVVALPLFGLAIVSTVAMVFGLVLLVVPGVMLMVMWAVATPALVEERLGVFDALRRSRELTRGARWKVLGLFLVLLIAYWIFSIVIGTVLVVAMGGSGGIGGFAVRNREWWVYVYQAAAQTLNAAIWGVATTSLYVELREWKDGPAGDRLAEVFL